MGGIKNLLDVVASEFSKYPNFTPRCIRLACR